MRLCHSGREWACNLCKEASSNVLSALAKIALFRLDLVQRHCWTLRCGSMRQHLQCSTPLCAERPEVVEDRRQPKALLQQWCQRQGWLPPRFEKLPVGGQRMASAGIRYSVTLEAAPPSGPAHKKKALLLHLCCSVASALTRYSLLQLSGEGVFDTHTGPCFNCGVSS